MSSEYQRIVRDGLWDNNGVLAMLLGLCPTMAMTTSATTATSRISENPISNIDI